MCIQQGHTFLINNSKPNSQNCSALTIDKIELEQIVTFEEMDIGLNVIPAWDVMVGSISITYSASAKTVTSTGTQTYTFVILNPNAGNYKIMRSYVLVSGYPQCSPSVFNYGCDNLTLSLSGTRPSCKYTIRAN